MYILRSIGVSSRAWLSVLRVATRPTLWLPFLAIAAVQLAVVAFVLGFHRSVVMPFALPLIRLIGGDQATHYPSLYFWLPEILSQIGLVVSVVFESLAVAVATLLFASAFGMRHDDSVLQRVARFVPRIILATLIPAAVVFAIGKSTSLLPDDLAVNRVARWATRAGFLLVVTLVQCLVAYAIAWIVLRAAGPIHALRNSVRVTKSTFLPTLIVVGLPILIVFPFHYIVGRTDLFITRFSPETIAGVVVARSIVELVLGFLLVGAITRLFLWRMEASR